VAVTVAIKYELVPQGVVLMPVVAVVDAPTIRAVEVDVAWALVVATSKNRNRIPRLPHTFRRLVDVARATLRVVATGVNRISDIF
jgi:acetolactate synthase small subunit